METKTFDHLKVKASYESFLLIEDFKDLFNNLSKPLYEISTRIIIVYATTVVLFISNYDNLSKISSEGSVLWSLFICFICLIVEIFNSFNFFSIKIVNSLVGKSFLMFEKRLRKFKDFAATKFNIESSDKRLVVIFVLGLIQEIDEKIKENSETVKFGESLVQAIDFEKVSYLLKESNFEKEFSEIRNAIISVKDSDSEQKFITICDTIRNTPEDVLENCFYVLAESEENIFVPKEEKKRYKESEDKELEHPLYGILKTFLKSFFVAILYTCSILIIIISIFLNNIHKMFSWFFNLYQYLF